MRIIVDAFDLRGANPETRDYFRAVVQNLLGRRSNHTFTIAGWSGASCGDCASFLSPLPRYASSWSIVGDTPQNGRAGLEERSVVFSPLGVPTRLPSRDCPRVVTFLGPATHEQIHGLTRAVMPSGSRVLTLTRSTLSYLVRVVGLPPGHVRWIPPGAGLAPTWESTELSADTDDGRVPSMPYLVTASAGSGMGRFLDVLEAFRLYTRGTEGKLRLLVLESPSFTRRQVVWWRGLGRHVRFVGTPSRSHRARILAGSSAFLPLVGGDQAWFLTGEALRTGVPVIAPREPPFTEILEESALFYSPGSVGELTSEIWRCLECGNLARVLAQRGIARARAYSWDVFTSRLLELFSEIEAHRRWGREAAA